MRRNLFFLLLFVAGCATTPPPGNYFSRPENLFPANGFLTQRAVLTIHGRQFTLNGYLALSQTGGQRLIVTENFGAVLADVLVKPDGKIFLMRSSRLFRPDWIKNYMAPDLECIFGGKPEANCPVKMLNPNHFMIQRGGYNLDLQIVETKSGLQSPDLFDETKRGSP